MRTTLATCRRTAGSSSTYSTTYSRTGHITELLQFKHPDLFTIFGVEKTE